ncbi:MAG: hypothetical protein UV51_C0010G0035 [Candidatus Woesebacteria bacterium GW2011_GWC1_42_9]|nr:MAG: hypothetical protein UV51_C0010G0035 [Candidatus Woesebacteria bacterium GW2011_GWC1_42_9]
MANKTQAVVGGTFVTVTSILLGLMVVLAIRENIVSNEKRWFKNLDNPKG